MTQHTLLVPPLSLAAIGGIPIIRISARHFKACDNMGRVLWQVPRFTADNASADYLKLCAIMHARKRAQS